MGLAAVELENMRLGADGPAAGEVFVAEAPAYMELRLLYEGGVPLPEEELGTGDRDLDIRLSLEIERC